MYARDQYRGDQRLDEERLSAGVQDLEGDLQLSCSSNGGDVDGEKASQEPECSGFDFALVSGALRLPSLDLCEFGLLGDTEELQCCARTRDKAIR